MRLLEVHRLELETFDHRNAPPYAVLSHTWGFDEVDYQTLISKPPVKRGRGWDKILRACDQAMQDHYNWIWIDTCNIDKSSSAELSEAINSMFVWYQRSAICYAFLEDVHTEDISQQLDVDQLLRTARWFKRGWTLQELIAPPKIIFYSATWEAIGTKNDLRSTLAEITGVNERVLENPAMLSTMSIAQKMSWASDRQTTRVEDIAYCLLGIFGVTMPLLYGEGSRAFLRLQEELINRFNDQTIFAWSVSVPLAPDTGERDDKAWESLLGGGVLALHPSAFKNSSRIVREIRLDTATEPIAITTRGILIEAYLMPTKNPTIYVWLLPCASTDDPYRVVIIPLRTPSSRTKRYSRIAAGIESIQYASEAYMSDSTYEQIYLKKAIEHNPSPISRICHLRSFPSHLLEPVEGIVVDLAKPTDDHPHSNHYGEFSGARPWDLGSWTADLGTSNIYNGIALAFRLKPSADQSKYLIITTAFPGPSVVSIDRFQNTIDTELLMDQIIEITLTNAEENQESIYIPEIGKRVSVKVDVEVEHGAIIYAFDIHFEQPKGSSERLIVWKEEGDEKEKVLANCCIMLIVPEEKESQFQEILEKIDFRPTRLERVNLLE
jgi:hypothetical protein